jgi:hypothetical protein
MIFYKIVFKGLEKLVEIKLYETGVLKTCSLLGYSVGNQGITEQYSIS